MQRKRRHYVLEFRDANHHLVELRIRQDHHAEQVLRGLVHAGVKVAIEEKDILINVDHEEEEDCCVGNAVGPGPDHHRMLAEQHFPTGVPAPMPMAEARPVNHDF